MADKLRKLGLKVALAGLQSYRSGIQSINKDNAATKQSMEDVAQGSKKLDLGMAALTGGMQALAAKGIEMLLGGLKRLGKEIYGMASEAGVVAGLKGAFEGLSASVGVTGAEMLQKFKVATGGMVTMKDAMMSFNKAAQLISTDFATMIPDAMGHLSKVSRATGASLDYLLDSLVVGVGRLSPMILDNLSIQVSLSEASERAAEMFGKNTKALSKQEKQLGMANIVMEKLAANTAHMPGVTGTATAAMASFGTLVKDVRTEIGLRFLPLLSEWMGVMNTVANAVLPKLIPMAENVANALMGMVEWFKRLVPAKEILATLKDLFGGIRDVITETLSGPMEIWGNWFGIIKAQVEGITGLLFDDFLGSLRETSEAVKSFFYEQVGPAIMEVSKYLTYFFRVARDVFIGITAMLKGDTEKATKFFQKAFNTAIAVVIAMFKNFGTQIVEWGKSLIASYSTGIYEGIRAYLSQALKAVADFIKGFMAPGSPPKFLPDIGTWGAGAMEEYLKGMGQADFSMLSKYTGQFKSELAALVQVGDLGAGQFADTFFELRGTVMQVMDTFKETGKVAAGALDILPEKLGKTGEAMAELIEKQLAMGAIEEELKAVAAQFEQINAIEEELSSQVDAAMSQVAAGLAEVALQEKALDLALQPFINNLEKLQATEDLVTDELRRQFEAGEIGLEEYEDRVKAAKEQTREAKKALDLEKAAQVDARQALETDKTALELQEEAIRAEEEAQRAVIDQQRAIVQEEATAIEMKRKALAEEMATLEARLAFHRETLSIMQQQAQMLKEMEEKMPAMGAGAEGEPGAMPKIEMPEMPEVEDALPTLDELRTMWEELPSGPAFDLGELLPDVEETKRQVSEWFGGALEGIQTSVQQSPVGQWILNALFVKLPKVVEGLRAWIQANFPNAYAAMSTAFEQAMEGNWPGALQTMVDYFSGVGDRIGVWWTENVQPHLDAFKLWWDTNWPIIQAVIVTVWTVISAIVSSVVNTIVNTVWPPLQEAITNLATMMAEWGIDWNTIWTAAKTAVAIVASVIGAILLALVAVITGIVTGIGRLLANMVAAWQLMVDGIVSLIAGFMVTFHGFFEVIKGIFTLDFPRVLKGLKIAWTGFFTFIRGLLSLILGIFRSMFGSILAFIGGFIKGVIDFFKNLYTELVGESIITDMLSDIWTLFTDTFCDVLTKIGEFVTGVIDFFTGLWDSLLGPEGTITKIGKDILDTITGAFGDVIKALGAEDMLEKFKTVGSDVIAGVWSGLKEKWQEVKGWILGRFSKLGKDVEDEMEVQSPSKVFARIGAAMAEGVKVGFDMSGFDQEFSRQVAPSIMMGGASSPIGATNNYSTMDQSTRYGDQNLTMPVTVIDSQVSLAQFKSTLREVLAERG